MQFINGQWLTGAGVAFHTSDPTTGQIAWQGHAADAAQVAQAVQAAHAAFSSWSALPLESRIALLQHYANALEKQHTQLSTIIAEETGKPLWDAKSEVMAMIGKIAISINAYHERTGTKKVDQPGAMTLTTTHRPIGVFAVFGPFNFPGHLPNGHIVSALLAGNTVVFKPSEYTPRTAIAMAKIWESIGLPAGVLNIVLGTADIGRALTQHDHIDGVLFTGSYQTGKHIHQHYAGQPEKILALEMGGNNPLIVWDVEDLQAAAYYTIQSAYISAGQRCTCARRLIIGTDYRSKAFLSTLQEMMQTIQVGDWRNTPEPFMGPVITAATAKQLLEAQTSLQAHGATLLQPLQQMQENTGFLRPGLIDVTAVSDKPDQEFFGPLLQVIRVDNFAMALRAANATRYGLCAGLISDHLEHYQQFYDTIRTGVMSWNRPTTGASSAAPFGGIGYSGNHRPSAYYAADYCAYPVARTASTHLALPATFTPGITVSS